MLTMTESNYMGRMPYTSEKWRKCRIWLRTESAPRCVEADVIGAVGVHVAPYSVDGEQAWTLTHIPTGRAIVDRPVNDARAVAEALASVARELNTASVTRARKVCAGVIGE
jgi:hypothetical protein